MASLIRKLERRWRDAQSKRAVPEGTLQIIHSNVGGHHLLVRANEDVGRAIHFTRDFEAAETRFLTRMVKHDAMCFDVGANIGYFTILLAGLASEGSVHAFEPLPMNAALLAASIEMNRFDNIRLIRGAVGADCGEVTFTEASDSAFSSLRDTGRKVVVRTLTVPMTTLDAYCAANGIDTVDILKCDVEGAEGLVLDGASTLLASPERQPGTILIELYQPNLDPFGIDVAALMARLTDHGYTATTLAEDGTPVRHDPQRPRQPCNFVFIAPRMRGLLG